MKIINKYSIFFGVFLLSFSGVFLSCENDELRVYSYPSPVVEDFNPKEARVGEQITITGNSFGNYAEAVGVFFGEVEGEVVSIEDTKIVSTVPEGAEDALIRVKVWTDSDSTSTSFTLLPSPKIDRIEPTTAAPGETITIYGENFAMNDETINVIFAGEAEAEVVSFSNTEIQVIVPEGGMSGEINVTVGTLSFNTQAFAYPLIGLDYTFDEDGNTEGWVATQNASYEVSGGSFNVQFDDAQFGAGNKRRADFKLESGTAIQVGSFPILAIKINKPKSGNFILDTNFGSYKNGANNWEGIIHGDIFYYDLRNSFGGGTTLPTNEITAFDTFQFKIADITTDEQGYSVDWVRSFENMQALEDYTQLEPGQHIYEFSNDRVVTPDVKDNWIGRLNDPNTTTVIEDGFSKVTFGTPSDGENKVRADFNYSHGGEWGMPGSGIQQDPWDYHPDYPIYAIKIHFVQNDGSLGGPRPEIGSIRYDRLGDFNDDYANQNVLWVDARNWSTEPKLEGSWWAIIIADILSDELGYWVDWHRTFKSVEELEAFIQ